MVGPYLLSLLDAGIALQGLITQVSTWLMHSSGARSLSAGPFTILKGSDREALSPPDPHQSKIVATTGG